jgi:hypothetical protein
MLLYMCISLALSAHCPTASLVPQRRAKQKAAINSNDLILPLSKLAPVAVEKGTVIDDIPPIREEDTCVGVFRALWRGELVFIL